MEEYLRPTFTIDCDSPIIREKAKEVTSGSADASDKAKCLFYFVRDQIKYNAIADYLDLEAYKASNTLMRGEGYCIQKAVLLATLARVIEIPSRICFADIRNHLLSENLLAFTGTNVFIHGYDELYIREKWVKVTPVFDAELCEKYGFIPVDFDGYSDAIFHRYDRRGKKHIEYLEYHGSYPDLPFDMIKKFFLDLASS